MIDQFSGAWSQITSIVIVQMILTTVILQMIPSIVMALWYYGSLTPGLEGTNITQLSSVYFIFGFSGIPIQNS